MIYAKLIVICATILIILQKVSTKKCIYVRVRSDLNSHDDFVECENVSSTNELSSDIRSDWIRLKIKNRVDDTFAIAG